MNWVRANRLTGRMGQRFASLAEIAKAAAVTNSLDLRNEAIASLTVPDLRPVKRWSTTPDWDSWQFDHQFRRYYTNDAFGNLTFREIEGDNQLFVLPSFGSSLEAGFGSPDNRWVATSDSNGNARIWDITERSMQPINFPNGTRLMAFTPDSHAVVVQRPDFSLNFLDPASGNEIKSYPLHERYPEIFFNHDGSRFFAMVDYHLLIHETESGRLLRTIQVPNTSGSAAWHPDGRRVAVGGRMKVGLWDIEEGILEGVFEGHMSQVTGIVFNQTGEWMMTTSWDCTTRVWQTETRRELLRVFEAGNGLRLSADGRHITFKSWNHEGVEMWQFGNEEVMRRHSCLKPPPFTSSIRFSPDGRLVVVVNGNGAGLYSSLSGRLLASVPVKNSVAVEFLPTGRELLIGRPDGLEVWPIQGSPDSFQLTVGPPRTLEPSLGADARQFALSADGRRAAIRKGSTISTFNLDAPFEVVRCEPVILADGGPTLSADGHWGASISSDHQKVQIWNGRTGESITNLPMRDPLVVSFSADDRWLHGSSVHESAFWETGSWKAAHRYAGEGKDEDILLGAFDPSSPLTAVVASAQGVRLTLAGDWQELATLPSERLIRQLTFSSDGSRLGIVYEPGYFQLWDLRLLRRELAALNLDWPARPYRPTNISGTVPLTRAKILASREQLTH